MAELLEHLIHHISMWCDLVKKYAFYERSCIDGINGRKALEEIPLLCASILHGYGSDITQCMMRNLSKLRRRYPGVFSTEDCSGRDVDAERKILEGSE